MASLITEPLEQKQVYATNQCRIPEKKTTVQTHNSYAQAVALGKNEVTYSVKKLEPDELSTTLHAQSERSLTEQTIDPLPDKEITHSTQTEVPSPDKETTTTKKKKKKKKKKNITDKDVVKSGATAARQAKKTTVSKEQGDMSKIASTENPALVVSDAEREKMRKVARQPKKASCKEVVNHCTSSPQNTDSCTVTKISTSIEEQKRQELHCKLNALIRSKRQTSLATNNKMVLDIVFPESIDLAVLDAHDRSCHKLLLEAKKIFDGEDKPVKDKSETPHDVNKFKDKAIEEVSSYKKMQVILLRTLLNECLQSQLEKVLQANAEARSAYKSIILKHQTILHALFLFLQTVEYHDDMRNLHSDKTTGAEKITEPLQVTQYFKSQIELGTNLCWCLNAMDEIRRLANFYEKKITENREIFCDLGEEIVEQYQRHLENCINHYQYSCSKVGQCPDYEDKKKELNEILRSQLDIFTGFKGACLSHNPQYTTQQIVRIIKLNYDICMIHYVTWNLVMLPSALKTLDAEFTYLQECLCANTSSAVSCSSAAAKPDADIEILSKHFDFFYSKLDLLRCYRLKANQKFNYQLVPQPDVAVSDEIQQEMFMHHSISLAIMASFESGFFKWLNEQDLCRKDKVKAEIDVLKQIEEQLNNCQLQLKRIEAGTNEFKKVVLGYLLAVKNYVSWNIGELIAKLTSDDFVLNEVSLYVEQLELELNSNRKQEEMQNCSDQANDEGYKNEHAIDMVKRLLTRYNDDEQQKQTLLTHLERAKQVKITIEQLTQRSEATQNKEIKVEGDKKPSEIIQEIKQELSSQLKEFETLKEQHEQFKKKLEDEANKEAQMQLQALMKEIDQESEASKKVAPLPPPRPKSPDDDEPSMSRARTVEFVKPQDLTEAPHLIEDAYETLEQLRILASEKKWQDLLVALRNIQHLKHKQDVNESSELINLIRQSITDLSSGPHTEYLQIIEFHLFKIEYVFDISYQSINKMILYNRVIIKYYNKLYETSFSNWPTKEEDIKASKLILKLPSRFKYLDWLEKVCLYEVQESLTSISRLKGKIPNAAADLTCCFSLLNNKIKNMKSKLVRAKVWQCLNFQELFKKRGEHIQRIKISQGFDNHTPSENKAPLLTKVDTDKAQASNLVINGFIGKLDASVDSVGFYLKALA